MKLKISIFIKAILAGFMVCVGGFILLCANNVYYASLIFATGLFVIFTFHLNLYTSRVGYIVTSPPAYIFDVFIILAGNFAGAYAFTAAVMQSRIREVAFENAKHITEIRMADSPASIFILAVFCGVLMFIASESNRRYESALMKVIGTFLPVSVFIICGLEHSIANICFFTAAEAWSVKSLLWFLISVAGNAVGTFIFPLSFKLLAYLEKRDRNTPNG